MSTMLVSKASVKRKYSKRLIMISNLDCLFRIKEKDLSLPATSATRFSADQHTKVFWIQHTNWPVSILTSKVLLKVWLCYVKGMYTLVYHMTLVYNIFDQQSCRSPRSWKGVHDSIKYTWNLVNWTNVYWTFQCCGRSCWQASDILPPFT